MSQPIDWGELFGSDEDQETPSHNEGDILQSWHSIPGLQLAQHSLTHDEQMQLTNDIIRHGYFDDAAGVNQAMCFGTLPSHFQWLCEWVRQQPELLPPNLRDREPLFDQAILNFYHKGQGIISHVDLERFEDGIVIVSLLSSCVMTMRPADKSKVGYSASKSGEPSGKVEVPVLLSPGSVMAMSGSARYDWEHGIKEQLVDTYGNITIQRGTRISVTLRKLKPGQSLSEEATQRRRPR
ncbi:uncharacterized protein BYT42DRAFT_581022 [Radiomyces spectabilis]|uniref:uncharacterized protein n=1 Tax=Radiomyces spectabilis TaxID=64574 RepID=UPI00222023C3|nr:uncharacterized protein BYT42DRAFT_581022 [Radiomyces spectabilis]KAI8371659.1 hypothetical protein BYT42DRAFT_581022 [Radiomyces spectabilis]